MRRALLLVLALATTAKANPADTYGFGSRSTAMGGAVSASARDFSANYYNPSGLALARGTDLSVGYVRVDHHLSMNGVDSRADPVHGIVGGIVAPGSFGTLPFAFGIATLLNENRGAGRHVVTWTGRDGDGRTVASGIYLYRIDAGPYSQVRKMTLMK